jgi:hypothetical protein
MKTKTNTKAGGIKYNHNQTIARGVRVRSSVKAGGLIQNHNQTVKRGTK